MMSVHYIAFNKKQTFLVNITLIINRHFRLANNSTLICQCLTKERGRNQTLWMDYKITNDRTKPLLPVKPTGSTSFLFSQVIHYFQRKNKSRTSITWRQPPIRYHSNWAPQRQINDKQSTIQKTLHEQKKINNNSNNASFRLDRFQMAKRNRVCSISNSTTKFSSSSTR